MDFNIRLHNTVCQLLTLERPTIVTENAANADIMDCRALAEPKEIENARGEEYYQVFSQRNGFIPNLSIVDLLFNMGPEGLIVLQNMAKNL